MNFVFDHDGHTYAKRSACSVRSGAAALGPITSGDPAQVLCEQIDLRQEQLPPLESCGDDE